MLYSGEILKPVSELGVVKTARILCSLGCLLALLAFTCGAPLADELARLNARIMRDPNNIELNLQYAQAAEDAGQPEKALAAYERVLDMDPGNMAARLGIIRATKGTLPNVTQVFLEYGASWESNPRRLDSGSSSDFLLLGRATVKDDRTFGSMRWRTIGALAGQVYFDNGDLSYGFAGAETGPVIFLSDSLFVHAAVGAAGAYFNHRALYGETSASLTFENIGYSQYNNSLRLRGGYRQYNDFFPVTEGPFAEAIWKFTAAGMAGDDFFVFAPTFRWSDIPGTAFSVVNSEPLQPGQFQEYGVRTEYYRKVMPAVSLGGTLTVAYRDYKTSFDPLAGVTSKREELLITPGAALIFHQFMNSRTDLRFDYRFEHRDTRIKTDPPIALPLEDFRNHAVTMTFQTRY
jgi:hypothetical protein